MHISYLDSTNQTLKYATNASGPWVTETVGPAGAGGVAETSLALDATGSVHISYPSASDWALNYATDASGAWVTETVDPTDDCGYRSSIAVDRSGKIHIGYGGAAYATNASGTWAMEAVDPSGGSDPSIALDGSDAVHMAYAYDDGAEVANVKYATNVSGAWVTQVVDPAEGDFCSIALDSTDKAHITYTRHDGDNHFLQHATNATGAWVRETVLSTFDYFNYFEAVPMALDSSDKVHIAFSAYAGFPLPDFTRPALKAATNASGAWETWVAYTGLGDGEDPSIVVGPSGTVNVSHHGFGTLLLTSGTPPASSGWGAASTVDSESRGSHAFTGSLLLVGIPVGTILLWRARRKMPGLSR